jgi:hypothetical protein
MCVLAYHHRIQSCIHLVVAAWFRAQTAAVLVGALVVAVALAA